MLPGLPIRFTSRYTANPMSQKPYYSPAEIATIIALWPAAPAAVVLAALPGRCFSPLASKAQMLGLVRNVAWPPAKLTLLHEHYVAKGGLYVAALLDKTINAVHAKAAQEGLRRARTCSRAERLAKRSARQRARYQAKRAVERALAADAARAGCTVVAPARPKPAPCYNKPNGWPTRCNCP